MPHLDTVSVTFLDSGGEKGVLTINQPQRDEFADHLTALQPFLVAVAGVAGGAIGQTQISRIIRNTPTLPASRTIQRQNKFVCVYKDITETFTIGTEDFGNSNYGREFVIEIPCANLSVAGILNDRDEWTYDRLAPAAPWAAFKTAFEAYVKSPSGGDVELVRVVYVGRSR